MSKNKNIIFPILLSTVLTACGGSTKNPLIKTDGENEFIVNLKGEKTIAETPTIDGSIKNGQTLTILPQSWMNYYNDRSSYLNMEQYSTTGKEETTPVEHTLTWTCLSGYQYFLVFLATNNKMENAETYYVDTSSMLLKNLYAGTHYYYQIQAYYEEQTIVSRIFDFNTVDFFRLVNVPGIPNFRDFGNHKTDDGKMRTKQGLLYRSGELEYMSSPAKHKILNELNVKTELDLREKINIHETQSPLHGKVTYVNNGAVGTDGSPYYINAARGLNAEDYQPTTRDNLKTIANGSLPMIFHCSVGRDRTGTFAVLLNLLLGVNVEEIKEDFAAFVFSAKSNGASLQFSFASELERIFQYFETYIGKDEVSSGTIYERVEEYCKDIGVSAKEIASIRNRLLEEI